jgi:hypothetical protein
MIVVSNIVFDNTDWEEEVRKTGWEILRQDIIDMLQEKYKLTKNEAIIQLNNYLQYSFKKFNLKP